MHLSGAVDVARMLSRDLKKIDVLAVDGSNSTQPVVQASLIREFIRLMILYASYLVNAISVSWILSYHVLQYLVSVVAGACCASTAFISP